MKTNRIKNLLALVLSAVMTMCGMSPLCALAQGGSIAVTSAENGGQLIVTAAMTAETVTGTAIAAVYNENNELIAVQTKEASANVSFAFDRNEDAKTAKVMWWDDFGHITPQANADTEEITDTGIYVLMNIPYDEFYAAQSVSAATDYDAISSATNKAGNYGKSGGAYHSGTTASVAEDGTVTAVGGANNATNEGVIWPVKVSNSATLEALASLGGDEITDENKATVATQGRGQTSSTNLAGYQTLTEAKAYSYYILSGAPAYYIELTTVTDNKPVFGTSQGTAETKTAITPTVTYGSNWGDVQLGLSGASDVEGKQINAVVLTAESASGETVTTISTGLVHLYNVWSYSDVAWRNSQIDGLNGATLKNIRYYCNAVADGGSEPTYYVYDYPMNVKLLPAYTGSVTAAFESKTSIVLTGLPQDIENPKAQVYYTTGGRNATYTYLTPLVVDESDDDIDPATVNITNGKIAIAEGSVTNNAGTTQTYGTPVDGTTYTIAISSDNYAPFKVTADYTEPEVTITGYTPIETLVTDYIDKYASSYDLPEKVTFNLSDGNNFDVDVWQWSFTDSSQVAAGNTVTVKAILDDAPSPYKYTYSDYFDSDNMNDHPVTMQVTFNEAPPEVSFTYDESHLVSNVATYLYTEDPVLTLANYTGDGSDISMSLGYDYNYKTLTDGDGLTYNAETNTVTIDSSEIMANGFVSYLSKYLKVGSKQLSVYIKYTTDRSVMFEGASEPGSVSYSDVSWKTPLVKDVTFTNVPEADINAITFKCNGYEITDKLTFTKKTDSVYTLTVPYDEVKSYISSYSGRVSITMNVEGMSAPTISITYKQTPSLTLDSSKGYYATENPVVTMNNFDFIETQPSDVVVSWSLKDSDAKTTLTKGTGYTIDAETKKITLVTSNILGSSSLTEAKTITLYVTAEADSDSAQIDIAYKKDLKLEIDDVSNVTPYMPAVLKPSGAESYSGLEVYHVTDKLDGVTVSWNGTVTIPYAATSELLDANNSVTLTARLSGSPDAEFTVTYAAISDDGISVPVNKEKVFQYYNYSTSEITAKEGDLLKTSVNSALKLLITDDEMSTTERQNMGVTIKKKDDSEAEEISIGVSNTTTIYNSSWNTIGTGIQLGYFPKAKLFTEGEEGGAFTITFYKAGYAKTTLDIYLTNE